MATRHIALVAALLLWVAACSPGTTRNPAASATPVETAPPAGTSPTPTAPPTLTPETVTWAPLEDSPELARDPSWACISGVQIDGDRLDLQAGGDYLTIANSRGPQLAFEGDFGLEVTLEVLEGEWGAFVLFGALPQGDWWQGQHRAPGLGSHVHPLDGDRLRPPSPTSSAAARTAPHRTARPGTPGSRSSLRSLCARRQYRF